MFLDFILLLDLRLSFNSFSFFFNTVVPLYVDVLTLFLSYFFMPVFYIADVLTASTASYGLEGKHTAPVLCTSVSIYVCSAVVAGDLSLIDLDQFFWGY